MNVYSPALRASSITLFDELIEQLGPPFIVKENPKGGITVSLNQPMVTAMFAEENLVIRDPALKQFFLYENGGVWEDITEERLQHHFECLLRRVGEDLPITHLRDRRHLCDLVAMLRGRVEKKDAFATRPSIINVQNGVLRVDRNGYDFTEHHPTYYSRNQAPVPFDPDARCPKFHAFLDRALPNKDDQLVVQLFGAQFMLGKNFTQRILILSGRAKSGKSTLMKMLRLMVGAANVRELRNGQLDTRFEAYSYLSRTLLVGSDVREDFLSGNGVEALKKLTGDDLISVEKKNCADFKEMTGNLNIAITANARLRIKITGDADAWRRRIVIIAFTQPPVAEPDDELAERLIRDEASGILNWLLDGAMILMDRLSKKAGLPLSDAQCVLVNDLIDESDSLHGFVCSLRLQDDSTVTSDELCHGYQSYCRSRGWTAEPTAFKRTRTVVANVHGISQSHDIRRGTQVCRGYRGLAI